MESNVSVNKIPARFDLNHEADDLGSLWGVVSFDVGGQLGQHLTQHLTRR
jgi:hypothetical protein